MIFMGLFLPACITIAIRRRRNISCEKNWLSILLEYGKTVLFCNLVIMIIITYVFKVDSVDITALNSFPFFTKYVVMAVVYSAVIPYLEEIIKKLFQIKFTVLGKNEEE